MIEFAACRFFSLTLAEKKNRKSKRAMSEKEREEEMTMMPDGEQQDASQQHLQPQQQPHQAQLHHPHHGQPLMGQSLGAAQGGKTGNDTKEIAISSSVSVAIRERCARVSFSTTFMPFHLFPLEIAHVEVDWTNH